MNMLYRIHKLTSMLEHEIERESNFLWLEKTYGKRVDYSKLKVIQYDLKVVKNIYSFDSEEEILEILFEKYGIK